MNQKTVVGCLLVFLFLALIASLALNAVQFGASAISLGESPMQVVKPKVSFGEQLEQAGKSGTADRIVQIDLEGVITSSEIGGGLFDHALPMVSTIKRALEQATDDNRVKAIVLRINSPGGEVTASDILYAAVKAAAKKKPVVVYMDSMAASGGYYISCGATKIVASETTLTGSIGVIMESFSYHGLFDKVGLGTNTFASGAFKDTLSGARPMREDEKAYIQNLVGQMYDRFLGIVADARQLDRNLLKTTVADGRVLLGAEALKSKLVDQIGYVEDAYTLARQLGGAPDAMIVKYRRSVGLFDVLGMAEAAAGKKIEVDLLSHMLPRLEPGRAYYLPGSYVR
jgi:protease IV